MTPAVKLRRGTGKSTPLQLPFLPYGRQTVTEEDIRAVEEVLRSDWLTQGPTIDQFEQALAETVGAKHAVACANGTAALHLAMLALHIGPGDVVVTSPNTFLADANSARFVGADVQFADIDLTTGNMSADSLEALLQKDNANRIKAIVPVHFAGQPVELDKISGLARAHGAAIVEDACHALGATYMDSPVGSCRHSDMTVFSFHPVKHVAMGEGGAISTNDSALADRISKLRSHGLERQSFVQPEMAFDSARIPNIWYYEMQQPGYNYRLTDLQAALGLSQLRRLRRSVDRRNQIASQYQRLLAESFPDCQVRPLCVRPECRHAYHLFVVQIDFEKLGIERNRLMRGLKERGIGTQVHYIPIHLQPYYRKLYGFKPGDFPNAERFYAQVLSLPMYPALTDDDVARVVDKLATALRVGRVSQ